MKGHPASSALVGPDRAFPARTPSKLLPLTCAIALLTADLIAALLAEAVVLGGESLFSRHLERFLAVSGQNLFEVTVILSVTIAYLGLRGRYTMRTPFWSEASRLLAASVWAMGVAFLAGFFAHDVVAHLPGLVMLALFPILAILTNTMTKSALSQIGAWHLPVVLVGDGEAAVAAEAALASDPSLGYVVTGRLDSQMLVRGATGAHLHAILRRHQAAQIVFALDGDATLQRQLIDTALRDKVPFAIAPSPQTIPALAWEATRFFSHDVVMLNFQHRTSRTAAQVIKSVIDVSAALVLLVLSSPIFLLAFLFNLASDGPLFFAHQRLGIGGRMFPCLKFRTMVVDGDRVLQEALARDPALKAEWDATQKLRHDPRVTPFGRFLRKTSLDELPQLINVIRREMSLVGPRPIVQSEVRFYGEDIAHYYNTRPGVTGLWQVSGRSNTTYARRVQLDVWYVNNWSVWLDVAVLLKTLPAVLSRTGAH
ncbi:undecaprenyl-phosphate galactose phosphotransferase WbaP [Acidisoma sp. 7E03]